MDFPIAPAINKAISKRIEHPIYGYTEYSKEYYNAIKRWMKKSHSWDIDTSAIFPINSIVTGLNMAVSTLTNESDGIIIQPPIYSPFYSAITNQNRKVLENELELINGKYEINFEDFENKAKEAKLFLFCSPHNPIGKVYREDELQRLVDICVKYGVLIISDEVHSDLVYKVSHTPIASLPNARDITITLNSPSKSFNIMGICTAYAIIENRELSDKFYKPFKIYSLIHPNIFAILATTIAYTQCDDWLDELKEYLYANLEYIRDRLRDIPKIKAIYMDATFLVWLDCSGLNLSDEELEQFFIHELKLGLNRGVGFGQGGKGFMRLNFAIPRLKLVEVMDRFYIISNSG